MRPFGASWWPLKCFPGSSGAAVGCLVGDATRVPRVSGFRWEILVCTAVVMFIVKCGLSLRRGKGQCAQGEVSGKGVEETGPEAQACEVVTSCEEKASPLPLQILALAALNKDFTYFSVDHTLQLLKGICEGPFKSPHQLTDANPTSGASQEDGEAPVKKILEDSKDSPDLQSSGDRLVQEIGSCGHRVQEEAGEAGRPEPPDPGGPQAASENRSQLQTLSQIMLKMLHVLELLRNQLEGGGSKGVVRREAETGSSPDRVPVSVPSGGCQVKKEEPSRALMKEHQGTEELTRKTPILSLQLQNTLLENEIQKLRLELQEQPKICEEHILQLERKIVEEQTLCLEVKKELIKVRRKADATYRNFCLYKKMAEDLCREWQKISSLYKQESLLYEKRNEETQKAVLWAKSEFQRLKEENHCLRQKLANFGPMIQPIPGGPPAPAVLRTAPRYPGGPKLPLNPQGPQQRARVSSWEGSRA